MNITHNLFYLRPNITFRSQLLRFNPLSPHDASEHHLHPCKTQFISLQLRVLERKFP